MLRPEAIESLFVLYRITGDKTLQDKAWKMFEAINERTKTRIAYAGIKDVTVEDVELLDSMESFWTAETLKYFYLIFSEPDVVSLDEYVLNTEAHPLLRPTE
ncbi:class I alpha-mannosidase [Teratosphaeria destructans]|uniref:alpha-1,2-Mannosidase n=1 Tax=Teratosphaeria destructans TaxID=418781 RepID=A0A9W7SQK0_9PEZI|nr:class I alpha-mannosidase [Teratosphaeria destructans]